MQTAASLQSKQNKRLLGAQRATSILPRTATAWLRTCANHAVKDQIKKGEEFVPVTVSNLLPAASYVAWPYPSMPNAEYSSLSTMYMCTYFRYDVLHCV